MNLRTPMQAGPAKANEVFAKLAETSDGAGKTREKLFAEPKAPPAKAAPDDRAVHGRPGPRTRRLHSRRPDHPVRVPPAGGAPARARSLGRRWDRPAREPVLRTPARKYLTGSNKS